MINDALNSLTQAAIICSTTLILWKVFRQCVVKSAFENIPGPPSESFIFGNLKQLLALDSWNYHDYLVENFPGIARLRGPLGSDILYVFEPRALHHILVKDQYIYEEARFFISLLTDCFIGEHHRKQRKMLNPVFSPKHMRHMIPIFYDVTQRLGRAMEGQVKGGATELDVSAWMGRTALEIVGQAGLGYSFDPLVSEKPDEYASALKGFNLWRKILRFVPHEGVRGLMRVADVLWKRSGEIYAQKKEALQQGDAAVAQQVGEGKDIMSILLKANMEASGEDKLEEQELIGQMNAFILAAMDTTSNALGLILTRLAEYPDVQQKLREEILEAGAHKGLDFDALMNLPFLEAVCRETLRIHAPVTQVFRETRKDVILPLVEPIRGVDGTMIHEIYVPKNTTVVAGLLNCNRWKALWGNDAYEWKPERWLSPLPPAVSEAKVPGVYSNLMTFLGGGRACIGFKFSQLEMKVVLSVLLSKFIFEKSEQPVFWNAAGVRYPSVGKQGGHASLPMKIRLYKGDGAN
ncbi:hypothetical protein BN946_scf184917.g14 [Trametes cinnabarina]|uniref:Cytochrome P450 n=1 Tax=Pycnoporus cinnabarinus TaxID=5643 RepID=A0A060SV43_PYCCI|nr:hypothetical protein BN946_scf184917.g14 [Trametes cinnabarina]